MWSKETWGGWGQQRNYCETAKKAIVEDKTKTIPSNIKVLYVKLILDHDINIERAKFDKKVENYFGVIESSSLLQPTGKVRGPIASKQQTTQQHTTFRNPKKI